MAAGCCAGVDKFSESEQVMLFYAVLFVVAWVCIQISPPADVLERYSFGFCWIVILVFSLYGSMVGMLYEAWKLAFGS